MLPDIQAFPPKSRPFNAGEDVVWQLPVKPSKVYVAAPVTNQASALKVALQLERAGFSVTSRWLLFDFSTAKTAEQNWDSFVERSTAWGNNDLEDLEAADTLVILADKPSTSGGYHVELGFFIGRGSKNIIAIGGRPNVFFWSKTVQYLASVDDLVDFLKSSDHGNLPKTDTELNRTHTTVSPPFPGDPHYLLSTEAAPLAKAIEAEFEDGGPF